MTYDLDSPFRNQLRAELESDKPLMLVNGSPMAGAIWNLIVSKRDLTLWGKSGIKPTRSWKVTTAKKYFGIKGTGLNLLSNFMSLYSDVLGDDE